MKREDKNHKQKFYIILNILKRELPSHTSDRLGLE